MYRIAFEQFLWVECDTAMEAVELTCAFLERTESGSGRPVTAVDDSEDEPEPALEEAEETDVEEPTEIEPEAPKASPPKEKPKPNQPNSGAFARYRNAAVEFLKSKGCPQMRSEVCRQCGIPKGSMSPVFDDERFQIVNGGDLWLAGVPLPSSAPVEFGSEAVARARDVIAAELAVADGPLSPSKLASRLHYDLALVREAVAHERFVGTSEGYELA